MVDIEQQIRDKLKELFSGRLERYYGHSIKVGEAMKRLVKDKNVDARTLIIAAYLHDVGYAAPITMDLRLVADIWNPFTRRKAHQEKGPLVSDKILRELKVNDKIRDRINYLISVHHRDDIEDEDVKLLIAADKA